LGEGKGRVGVVRKQMLLQYEGSPATRDAAVGDSAINKVTFAKREEEEQERGRRLGL